MTRDEFKVKRASLGLTQTALSEVLGVHYATVQRWEQGITNIPRTVELAMEAITGPRRVLIYIPLADDPRVVTANELDAIAADTAKQWEGPIRVHGGNYSLYFEIEPRHVNVAQLAAAVPEDPALRKGTKYPWGDDNPVPPAERRSGDTFPAGVIDQLMADLHKK